MSGRREKKRLGDLLILAGKITQEQLDEAVLAGQTTVGEFRGTVAEYTVASK